MCDFESLPEKISGCEPSEKTSYTMKKSKHRASGFTTKVISSKYGEHIPHTTYRGPNVPDVFSEHMLTLEKDIKSRLSHIEPMKLCEEEQTQFTESTEFHICHEPLNGDAVRDHDHVNGEFRGAAHNSCNLNYKAKPKIPVLFHNLRGYGAHIIMESIGKYSKRINCIPNNMGKYITFSLFRPISLISSNS